MKALTLILVCGLLSQAALAQGSPPASEPLVTAAGLCGKLENAYGPFDYRTVGGETRARVERFHFTPSVEALRSGESGPIGGDLDYTLRAFPNHPRALYAMARYGRQLNLLRVPSANYPVECYFLRAVMFAPDDPQVRALYADYLINQKQRKEAKAQLEAAERLEVKSPQTLYNLGLAWANLGENDKALALARKAYAGGITFPGLRDRLKAAGAWRD